jgi:DnaJ-class molecular chaperone
MNMQQDDYYQILSVDPGADGQAIKNAYRTLALKYHPDRNKDNPDAVEKMKSLNEAYAVLSNSEKRRAYDGLRTRFGASAHEQFRRSYTEKDIFSGSDINAVFEELAKSFGGRGFEELFKEIYGQGYRSFEFKRPGFSARGFIFTGGFGKPNQKGRGRISSGAESVLSKLAKYAIEKISGVELPEQGADDHDVIDLSPELFRDGGPFAYFHRRKSKKIIVKIPAGIKEGQIIRLAGLGQEGLKGGSPGDLLLKVRVHKDFKVKFKELLDQVKGSVKDLIEKR